MVQENSILKLADNTGAKKLRVIRVLGGYKKRYAMIGDVVTCSIREVVPHSTFKKVILFMRLLSGQEKKFGVKVEFT